MNPLVYEESGMSITAMVMNEFGDSLPRVKDLDLAEWLGYEQPRQIREMVQRNREEIERFGPLSYRTTTPRGGGPQATEYYFTEDQALLICSLSRTPKAADVRYTLIKAFTEWRKGNALAITPEAQSLYMVIMETSRQIAETSRQNAAIGAMVGSIATQQAVLSADVRGMKRDLWDVKKDVADLKGSKRKAPAKGLRGEMARCVAENFSGKCPCCGDVQIVDDDGPTVEFEADHWNSSHNARAGEVWPVCRTCNQRLDKQPGFKEAHHSEFETFQKRMRRESGQSTLLFSGGSKVN